MSSYEHANAPASGGPRRPRRGGEPGTSWLLRSSLVRATIPIFAVLAFVYLFDRSPTRSRSRSTTPAARTWSGRASRSTTGRTPVARRRLCTSLRNSLQIGVIATFSRPSSARWRRSRWPSPVPWPFGTNLLIFLPMATAEVVLGASLLTLFLDIGIDARVLDDRHRPRDVLHRFVSSPSRPDWPVSTHDLEQAAMDLYATEWQTFRRVTFPLVAAGYRCRRAAGLLPLVRRLHHHELQLRQRQHLPEVRVRVRDPWQFPAQVNVIGSLMFIIALLIVLLGHPREQPPQEAASRTIEHWRRRRVRPRWHPPRTGTVHDPATGQVAAEVALASRRGRRRRRASARPPRPGGRGAARR